MKDTIRICAKGSLVIVCAMFLLGCPPDGGPIGGGQCIDYEGEGWWPEYIGPWESIRNAAGSVNSNRAYLDVDIAADGTFSGIYFDYIYDYTWQMPTHMGTIPVSVYNPFGSARRVCGVINFDEKDGIVNFVGIGETTFTLTIHSAESITLGFPSGFHYTSSNIRLQSG